MSGATLVLSEDLLPNATHYSLVPTQVFRIVQDPLQLEHYQKVRCILVGGGPMTASLHARARENGLSLTTTWGMTETTAMATFGAPSPELHAGKLLPHMEMSLTEEDEIKVRGPALFQGYLDQSLLRCPLDPLGWFATKDLGFIDHHGCLHIKGRKDLLFISGGENIQPEEIEEVLGKIPGVMEAIVVPAANPEFGSLPTAFIRTLSSSFDPHQLREALLPLLPSFKIPRRFFPFPDKAALKTDRSFLSRFATQNF
jgi:O-succinylbenzoic acid--CoA ligase